MTTYTAKAPRARPKRRKRTPPGGERQGGEHRLVRQRAEEDQREHRREYDPVHQPNTVGVL